MRLSRLSRTAEGQLTVALEPIHDHLALAPVRPFTALLMAGPVLAWVCVCVCVCD